MFATFVSAQETKVSEEVETAFHQKFPEGKEATWDHKGHDFVVSFSEENEVKTAAFDEHGAWKYTKSLVATEDIPADITASIEETHHEGTIDKAYRVITEEGAFFKVFVKTADNETFLVKVDEKGTILKSEKYNQSVDTDHKIN